MQAYHLHANPWELAAEKYHLEGNKTLYFWFKYDLGQKYQAPQVPPDRCPNSWPPDHDSTFHVNEMPALTTRPSVTCSIVGLLSTPSSTRPVWQEETQVCEWWTVWTGYPAWSVWQEETQVCEWWTVWTGYPAWSVWQEETQVCEWWTAIQVNIKCRPINCVCMSNVMCTYKDVIIMIIYYYAAHTVI